MLVPLFLFTTIPEGKSFCCSLLGLHSSNMCSGTPENKALPSIRKCVATAFLLQGRQKIDFSHFFTAGEIL